MLEFTALPGRYFLSLFAIIVAYLIIVEVVKRTTDGVVANLRPRKKTLTIFGDFRYIFGAVFLPPKICCPRHSDTEVEL